MSSRHLVEPDLIAFLDAMPTMTLSADNLAAIRAARDGMLSQLPPFPETVSV